VAHAFDEAAATAYPEAQLYFRGYGPAPGDASALLAQLA
jgi:hypothetical protein